LTQFIPEFKIRLEEDEYDDLVADLVDLAQELDFEDCRIILRVLSKLVHGEWVEKEPEKP